MPDIGSLFLGTILILIDSALSVTFYRRVRISCKNFRYNDMDSGTHDKYLITARVFGFIFSVSHIGALVIVYIDAGNMQSYFYLPVCNHFKLVQSNMKNKNHTKKEKRKNKTKYKIQNIVIFAFTLHTYSNKHH